MIPFIRLVYHHLTEELCNVFVGFWQHDNIAQTKKRKERSSFMIFFWKLEHKLIII